MSIRRHSAVMCLEVLAKNCPTLFFVHVGTFFEIIWTGMEERQKGGSKDRERQKENKFCLTYFFFFLFSFQFFRTY